MHAAMRELCGNAGACSNARAMHCNALRAMRCVQCAAMREQYGSNHHAECMQQSLYRMHRATMHAA
eukprot:scaffold317254_cov19-Tisochrysis_lutea.AAC.1